MYPSGFWSRGGGYLLSHFRSIIGVVRFNFSVRNGKRWNPHAIATLVRSSVVAISFAALCKVKKESEAEKRLALLIFSLGIARLNPHVGNLSFCGVAALFCHDFHFLFSLGGLASRKGFG